MSHSVPIIGPDAAADHIRELAEATPGRAVIALIEAPTKLWSTLRGRLEGMDRPVELVGVDKATPDADVTALNLARDLLLHECAVVGYLVSDLDELRRVVRLAPDLLSGLAVELHVDAVSTGLAWQKVRALLRERAEIFVRSVPWPDPEGYSTLPLDLLLNARGVLSLPSPRVPREADGRSRHGGWLIGTPGSGRTTALRARANAVLGEGVLTPVHVSLVAWQDTWRTRALPLSDWFPRWLEEQGNPGAGGTAWQMDEIALLLDDADRLDPDLRRKLIDELPSLDPSPEVWCAASPVTWRRGDGRWRCVVDVPPADPTQMVFSVEAALDHLAPQGPVNHGRWPELRTAILTVPEFRAIATTPLLLASAVATWVRRNNFPLLPRDIIDFAAADPRFVNHALVDARAAADRLATQPGADPDLTGLTPEFGAAVVRAWAENDQRAALRAAFEKIRVWARDADVRAVISVVEPLLRLARLSDGRAIWDPTQRRDGLGILLDLSARDLLPDEVGPLTAAIDRVIRGESWRLDLDTLRAALDAAPALPAHAPEPVRDILSALRRAADPAAPPVAAETTAALEYAATFKAP